MKTFKKSLVAVALVSALTANANLSTPDTLNGEIEKTTLKISDVKSGQKLVLKDNNETILYREHILNSGNYRRNFDLTSLPTGIYFFELDQGFAYRIIPFEVKEGNVVFVTKKEQLIFTPIIVTEGNILKIGKSPLSNAPVKVKIFYGSGSEEIIYTDEINSAKKGFRSYKLLEDKPGNYYVVCEFEGRKFSKQFKF